MDFFKPEQPSPLEALHQLEQHSLQSPEQNSAGQMDSLGLGQELVQQESTMTTQWKSLRQHLPDMDVQNHKSEEALWQLSRSLHCNDGKTSRDASWT